MKKLKKKIIFSVSLAGLIICLLSGAQIRAYAQVEMKKQTEAKKQIEIRQMAADKYYIYQLMSGTNSQPPRLKLIDSLSYIDPKIPARVWDYAYTQKRYCFKIENAHRANLKIEKGEPYLIGTEILYYSHLSNDSLKVSIYSRPERDYHKSFNVNWGNSLLAIVLFFGLLVGFLFSPFRYDLMDDISTITIVLLQIIPAALVVLFSWLALVNASSSYIIAIFYGIGYVAALILSFFFRRLY